MRDLSLLIMLFTLAWMAWKQPWVGVLGLTLLGAMHPQGYGSEWMAGFPIYQSLFLVTLVAAAVAAWNRRTLPSLAWDWRLPLLGLLLLNFVVTTHYALLPTIAKQTLLQVGGLFPPLLLALLLIDSREKFHAMVVTCAAAIALVALKGGYWAVMTGFQDRVYGPPDSQIGGNNEFSIALAMTIPLLVLWLRQAEGRGLRMVIVASIGLCYVAALTSWSRGGLVTLLVMTALLVWHSQRKWLVIPFVALGIGLSFVNLPDTWHQRMQTISAYEEDQSFQGRQEVWHKGLAYLRTDPWTGSGFEGWLSINATFHGGETPAARDWHSAYVEIATEQGIPGLVLWSGLLFGSLIHLSWLIRRGRRLKAAWLADSAAMLRAALLAYAVGGLTLGIAYWEAFFLWLALAMILGRLARDLHQAAEPSRDDGVQAKCEVSDNFTVGAAKGG